MITQLLSIFVLAVAAYFLGSIPFGLLVVRILAGTDIRHIGSGNIGATNVRRAVGNKWAAVTLICDALKGAVPVLAASWQYETTFPWLPPLAALAAVAGHMYPVWFKFKPGGKGVATTLGCMLIISPLACLIAILIFIPAVYFSRRISVGSLTATVSLPPAIWFTAKEPFACLASIVIMVLILCRHEENIQRIAQGVEPTIGVDS